MAIPDWLARLQAQGGAAYTDPTSGQQYVPMQTNGATGPQDGYASIAANTPGLGQYVQNDYSMYDGQGNKTGTKTLGYTDDAFVHYMPYLIAAAATAGAAGAYGGAGAGLESGTVASGATVGGPMSVGGATGTELGTLGATGAGGVGGAGSLVGSSGSLVAPAGLGAQTAGTGLWGSGVTASSLGGMGGLLGPAATLLGGMLGSKGVQKSETTTKDIPDWLKPSVAGLLTQTDALRNKQMAPGYLQGYDDMRTQGQNLLNAPIAGNGVGKVAYPQFGFKR